MRYTNEFRLGNLLYNKQRDEVFKIEWLDSVSRDFTRIGYKISDNEFYEDNYYVFKPVLITTQILEKCGFEKDKDGVYRSLNCLYWLDSGYLQIANGYSLVLNAPCKYLHQLQNLIFSLTGKELETNILIN